MVRLQSEPIDLAAVVASVADPEHGGLATFLGTTRAETTDRAVVALDYEAHEQMAPAELGRIVEEAEARYGARCALVHRTGPVPVGEASVATAASAAHRAEAFAACRYLIDQVKQRAPIWKRTRYADGVAEWQDGLERAAS